MLRILVAILLTLALLAPIACTSTDESPLFLPPGTIVVAPDGTRVILTEDCVIIPQSDFFSILTMLDRFLSGPARWFDDMPTGPNRM